MVTLASTDLKKMYEGADYTNRYHDAAGERISRVVEKFSLNKTDKVLDVGCGNGLLFGEIIKKIYRYDGVDFSTTFIQDAKKRAQGTNVKPHKYQFYAGDVVDFCRDKKDYDKIFALDFVEHINDKELIKIFSSIKDSMKKGAQLVIHTPNKNYLLERVKSNEVKINKQGHIGLRNADEYAKIFRQIGFSKVEVVPLNHYLQILKPLHLLSYIPIKHISSLFQARLLVICEK